MQSDTFSIRHLLEKQGNRTINLIRPHRKLYNALCYMYNALCFIYNALRYINIALHYIVFSALKNISFGGRNNLCPHCIQIFCRVVIAIVIAGRKVLYEVWPPFLHL